MKKNILCIDDIKTNLFTMQSVIESADENLYEVFIAESATDGLDIILRNKIDLILLDIMMPEIDGFEAAKMIKSNKKTKNIPIIFVTAKNDDGTIEACYNIGAVDYINKPFNAVELLNRIEFHLSLVETKNAIEQEKLFTQNILDMQDNMIIVSDALKAIHVNSATLDFFGLKSIKEIKNKDLCIHNRFQEEEGFFYLDSPQVDKLWIDTLIEKLEVEDIVVKILKDEIEHIFTIKASKLNELYILSFTDISFISKQSKIFEHSANFDTLTQIYNRNMFHKVMSEKITFAKQNQSSFIFVMLDIDHFKQVNDTYGHLVGDKVLKSITHLIKQHIRKDDLFARWGGEEFVLSFEVSLTRGLEIANSLKKHISQHTFETVGKITCSFGVTEYINSEKLDDILLRADKALYNAKESGRDRVCQA